MTDKPNGDARAPEGASDGLRERVIRGGRLLAIRQVVGLIVAVAGTLALTRLIGPTAYGVYAAAFGIAFFAQTMGEFSIDIFLVRHSGEVPITVYHQAFTLLLMLSVATTGLMIATAPWIASVVDIDSFTTIAIVLFSSIPVMHLQQVPLARLERALDYESIGVVEVSAQVAFFLVAVPLAATIGGAWAPALGWWAQQLVLLGGFWFRDDYRPRLVWQRALVREILAYGSVTTTATFAYATRNLVNPLLVGGLLGATAVGYVALASRIIEQLSFARNVIMRLSVAVLALIVTETERMRRALTWGMELQLLAVGLPVAGFSLLAGILVPTIFGEIWSPVAELVPLLAPPAIALAAFGFQQVALLTQARPWDLIAAQAAGSLLLWAACAILLPEFGINGFAYGELVAMVTWLLSDRLLARRFPRPEYAVPLTWWLVLSAVALSPVTTWWLLLAVPVGALVPGTVTELRDLVAMALSREGITSPFRGAQPS